MTVSDAAEFGWSVAGPVMVVIGTVAVALLALGIMHGWLGGR